jgi:hypothetical protein
MTLATADLTFTDASPMASAMLTYQIPAPVDNDYLRVAVLHGVGNIAPASAALHTFLGYLTANF